MLIGDVKLPGNIFLAPMAGVTDLPFRLLCKEQGASLVYTEMLSAKAMHYGDEGTFRLSETHPEERPVAAQIFGHEPEIMAEAAAVLSARDDICIIDVNMGCPAPKIIKNGDGACLMQKPALVREIVREIRKASKKPVTVKIRKGWDKSSANTVEIASICEEEGASAVTVHGRTRDQQYSGETDLECIREVKRALRIPVIGNGDIRLPEDARRMFEATGCDAVMIGRAAKANPWIFSWRSREEVPIQEVAETAIWQLGDMLASDPENAVLPFRKYLKAYLEPSHLPRETMRTLLTCPDPTRLLALMNEIFRELGATLP